MGMLGELLIEHWGGDLNIQNLMWK